MAQCMRLEFKECPYRHEKIDYEHWVRKCKKSSEFARERTTIMCQSTPCNYALEMALKAQAD